MIHIDTIDLLRSPADTFSVTELRHMLGIGKTESYWLLKHKNLKTIIVKRQLRIPKVDFMEWYDSQTRYSLINGPPPGKALRAMSYSVNDLAELLGVSETTIYAILENGVFDTFTAEFRTRITKESFDRWYRSQSRYQTREDRAADSELLATTYSMPDIRRMLGIHRNTVYYILEQNDFDFVTVANRKRVTIESFDRWYRSQKRYQIHITTENPEKTPCTVSEPYATPAAEPTHPRTVENKPFYSIGDLQTVLGISRKSAYRLVEKGKVLAIKLGKAYLISADEFHKITEGRQDNGHDHSEE